MNEIEVKLKAHFAAYTKNLPNKIAQIESLWNSLLREWDHEKLVELHIKTHGLRGSAGIYGHENVGIAATNLDMVIKEFLNRSVPTEQQKNTINRLLEELKKTLETGPSA